MYRGTSPIFDVSEFPTLRRRVKPLPKRRRTIQGNNAATGEISTTSGVGSNHRSATASLGLGLGLAMGLALPGPDATAEELLAHADSLSAQMALQSYYMPILGGVQDLFKVDLENGRPNIDFGVMAGYGSIGTGAAGGGRAQQQPQDEDDRDDGDYIDHLQQPGNTKKRKVPTNASRSPRGYDAGSTQSSGEDESTDRSILTGRPEDDLTESLPLALAPAAAVGTKEGDSGVTGILSSRKGKISPATMAGLQHKEMLRNRKRQLAAVLGALSHGDTLALDQALSASMPFMAAGFGDPRSADPQKVRLSRREVPCRARAVRSLANSMLVRHPDAAPFPTCEFTFTYPSATSDRLVATREEVSQLRNRFEAELARQATNASKLATASKLMATFPPKGSHNKRSDRVQQRARIKAVEGNENEIHGPPAKPRGKKKKRSALANAANPHHLKNYVPSRLPHSGQTTSGTTNVNAHNFLGPPPLRFLSADIPPRRRKKSYVTPTSLPINPMDEWICALCDYRLFYGGDHEYRRSVKMRKKILRRRRRARERAAAAASGNKPADAIPPTQGEYDDDGSEPTDGAVPRPAKVKGEVNRNEESGGSWDGSFG